MKRKDFILFIVTITILLIIPLVVYIINFWNFDISNNHQDWYLFSNYFSGISLPILSFANVIVIIWLAISVANLDNDRKEKEIQFQQKIFEISNETQRQIAIESNKTLIKNLKTQMQFEQYCKLSDKLELISISLFNEIIPQGTIISVIDYLTEFSASMTELLPALNDLTYVKELNLILERLRESFKGYDLKIVNEASVLEINDILNEFQIKKLLFLRYLQRSILSKQETSLNS
jgi:hypothetical protein